MRKRFITLGLALLLSVLTLVSLGVPPVQAATATAPEAIAKPSPVKLTDGEYAVQQATYDDADGEYRLALLNTKPGEPSILQIANLPMARLTDEEIQAGKKSYLKVENNQPALYLTEDFKIEYVHNVTEVRENPQTGQTETVVVRRESNFWTPFAGALAGQALGNLLFRPYYYMPPVYVPGRVMTGYGGYGNSYDRAVSSYQKRYKAAPPAVKNRQTFRTTGKLKSPTAARRPGLNPLQRANPGASRSTGSGYGTSTLRRPTTAPKTSTFKRPPASSFGSARPKSSFGSSRGFGSARPRSFSGARRR